MDERELIFTVMGTAIFVLGIFWRLAQQRWVLQAENLRLSQLVTQQEMQINEERRNAQEKLQLVEASHQKFAETFKALSADILQQNNESFLTLAKASLEKYQEGAKGDLTQRQQAIDNLVKPIKASLEQVDQKIAELEKARAAAYGGLAEQVRGLANAQTQLQSETANLVKALRQPTVRGRWGEMQLRRVVEMAGMVDQCDFVCQTSTNSDYGQRRPDLLVKLPNDHQIIVDAKTPLSAYLEALEAKDESMAKFKLQEHARQIRTHILQLSQKAYWHNFSLRPTL